MVLDGDRGWVAYDVDAEVGVNLDGRTPLGPRGGPVASESPILVQLASFRDSRCGRTIWDAFSRAVNPGRVHFAVVDQIDEGQGDEGCVDQYCRLAAEAGMGAGAGEECPGRERILVDAVRASASHGPAMARARQLDLVSEVYSPDSGFRGFEGEALCHGFCLQLDAHSLFRHGWDSLLVASWEAVGNEFAVITTYPAHVDQRDQDRGKEAEFFEVPTLCRVQRGSIGVPRNTIASAARHMPRPFMGPLWGAGLSFGKCHGDRAVPADPLLVGVFDGEEFSRGARLWTSGYDMYSAHRNFVFHDYDRGGIRGDGGWGREPVQQGDHAGGKEDGRDATSVAGDLAASTSAASRYALAEGFMRRDLSEKRLQHVLGAVREGGTGTEEAMASSPHLWASSPGQMYGIGVARPLKAYARHIRVEGDDWSYLFGAGRQLDAKGMCAQRTWTPYDVRCTYLGVLGVEAPGCSAGFPNQPTNADVPASTRHLLSALPVPVGLTLWDLSEHYLGIGLIGMCILVALVGMLRDHREPRNGRSHLASYPRHHRRVLAP